MFNVSFVRQYAESVGLDPDRTVEEFRSIYTCPVFDKEDCFGQISESSTLQLAVVRLREEFGLFLQQSRRPLFAFVVACTLFLVSLILYSTRPQSREIYSVPGRPNDVSDPLAMPPQTASAVDEDLELVVSPVEVQIEIIEPAWVRAIVDGQRVLERTLKPGDFHVLKAEDAVWLLIGNAGGVSIVLNGAFQPPIGSRGQVRRVILTPLGMKTVGLSPRQSSQAVNAWERMPSPQAVLSPAPNVFTQAED